MRWTMKEIRGRLAAIEGVARDAVGASPHAIAGAAGVVAGAALIVVVMQTKQSMFQAETRITIKWNR